MKKFIFLIFLLFTLIAKTQIGFNQFNEFVKDSAIIWANTFINTTKISFNNFSLYNYLYDEILVKKKPTFDFEDLLPYVQHIQSIDTLKNVIWEGDYFAIDNGRFSRSNEEYKTLYLKFSKDREEKINVKEIIYFKNNRLYSKPYLAMPFIKQFTLDSNKAIPKPKFIGYISFNDVAKSDKTGIVSTIANDTFDLSNDNIFRGSHFITKEYFKKNFLHYLQDRIVNKIQLKRLNDSTQIAYTKEADYYFYDSPLTLQVSDQTDTTFTVFKDTVIYNDIYLPSSEVLVLKRKWTFNKKDNTLSNNIFEVDLLNKEVILKENSISEFKFTLRRRILYKK